MSFKVCVVRLFLGIGKKVKFSDFFTFWFFYFFTFLLFYRFAMRGREDRGRLAGKDKIFLKYL
jgi:hypothetical protein